MSYCTPCEGRGYRHQIGTDCPFPTAPWYVRSIDPGLSYWRGGPPGLAQTNVCVVACDTRAEAQSVLRYVKSRSDQTFARITPVRPRAKRDVLISNMEGWRARAREQDEAEAERIRATAQGATTFTCGCVATITNNPWTVVFYKFCPTARHRLKDPGWIHGHLESHQP